MRLKHPFILRRLSKCTLSILSVIVGVFFIFAFLLKTGIITISNNGVVFNNSLSLSDRINMTSIVTTQVSISFLVVSISSLIANVEKKYFFGKSAIKIVFKKHSMLSFCLFLFLLVLLSILNIYFLITDSGDTAILLVFVFAILVVSFFVYRFTRLFIDSENIKRDVLYKYYKSNIKHIKRATPTNSHPSKDLQQLLDVTVTSIQTNDSIIYNNNILAYIDIIKPTLFNYKKMVQEYYTESIFHNDAIAHLGYIANELAMSNYLQQSLYVYNRIFDLLNYYGVISISDHNLYFNSSRLISRLKGIENETLANNYFDGLTVLISKLFYQLYLYATVDLSYCRLASYDLIRYYQFNDHIENLYLSIYCNKHLSVAEKNILYDKLFDYLRMVEHYQISFPRNIIEDFLNKQLIPKKLDNYPVEIIAEPIAVFFLKMYENKDTSNINLFLKMGLSPKLSSTIKILVLLSIIEILYHDNKRIYEMDLNIEPDSTIDSIKGSNLLVLSAKKEELIDIYALIKDKYILQDGDYAKGSYYGFCPKFRFSEDVINSVFFKIIDCLDERDEILKMLNLQEFSINKKVETILDKFHSMPND